MLGGDDLDQWTTDFSRPDRGRTCAPDGGRLDRRHRRADAEWRGRSRRSRGEIFSPPVLSICTSTARWGATQWKERRKRFARFAIITRSGGTTSLLLTTVTAPMEEIVRVVGTIESEMPNISQLRGAHVEGPFISREKHGAQRTDFIVEPRAELVDGPARKFRRDQAGDARPGGAGRARIDFAPNENWNCGQWRAQQCVGGGGAGRVRARDAAGDAHF